MGSIKGVSDADGVRLDLTLRNRDFPRKTLCVTFMQLPSIFVRGLRSVAIRILDDISVWNGRINLNTVVNREAESISSRLTNHICHNVNIAPGIVVRRHIVSEGTA
jgi:hypothetical protein